METYGNIAGKHGTLVGESSQCGDCRYVDPLFDDGLCDIEFSRLKTQGKLD